MFKLVLEKAEEVEIKLPTSVRSSKKQENSRKTCIFALITTPKPLTVWITTSWKILQELGIPDNLNCLLRYLYAGREITVRNGHGMTDCFQIAKGVRQGWMLLPSSFNIYAEFSSVAQSCPTLCDPMNRSMPGLPVHHHFLEFTHTHVHRVCDAIQPSHPLLSPSPPAPNPSQHQSLFQWVNSSHEVAKVLELQL